MFKLIQIILALNDLDLQNIRARDTTGHYESFKKSFTKIGLWINDIRKC